LALAPKTYFSIDENIDEKTNTKQTKIGTKGIQHDANLQYENFERALFGSSSNFVQTRSLTMKDGKMCRTNIEKLGLSDIFVKYRVEDDRITCTPLTQNGKII